MESWPVGVKSCIFQQSVKNRLRSAMCSSTKCPYPTSRRKNFFGLNFGLLMEIQFHTFFSKVWNFKIITFHRGVWIYFLEPHNIDIIVSVNYKEADTLYDFKNSKLFFLISKQRPQNFLTLPKFIWQQFGVSWQ